MPESGEHDLFGVPIPMITSADLARAFQMWLRELRTHPNVADTRRVTTLIRSFVRTFTNEELELLRADTPDGARKEFDPLREVIRLELERRDTVGQ